MHQSAALLLLVAASAVGTGASASFTPVGFIVEIETGGLAGQLFPGRIGVDPDLVGAAVLSPGEFDLRFRFLDTVFTEADDFVGAATAEITQFGLFGGLGYTVDSLGGPNAFFGFTPSDASIGQDFFYERYDDAGGLIDEGGGRALPAFFPLGDFNYDSRVDNGDLSLLLGGWGDATVPLDWLGAFSGPAVDNDELGVLLLTWGDGTGAPAPEPTTLALLLAVAVAPLARRR